MSIAGPNGEPKITSADAEFPKSRSRSNRRIQMRKISIFAIALILAGVGAWTMRTPPRVDASAADAVYPLQLMTGAKNLPEGHYVDYTFVFN